MAPCLYFSLNLGFYSFQCCVIYYYFLLLFKPVIPTHTDTVI